MTGIPGGARPLEIAGAELIRQLVLDNQVMVGSVNAARDHFQMAIDDLGQVHLKWGNHVDQLITTGIQMWNLNLHWIITLRMK